MAELFADRSVTQAPVVDRDDPARPHGLITLEQLLHARHHDLHEERHRQRLLLAPTRGGGANPAA